MKLNLGDCLNLKIELNIRNNSYKNGIIFEKEIFLKLLKKEIKKLLNSHKVKYEADLYIPIGYEDIWSKKNRD